MYVQSPNFSGLPLTHLHVLRNGSQPESRPRLLQSTTGVRHLGISLPFRRWPLVANVSHLPFQRLLRHEMRGVIFEYCRHSIGLQTWLLSGEFVNNTVHCNLERSFYAAVLKMSFAHDSLRRQLSICPLDVIFPFSKSCWVGRCGEQRHFSIVRPISASAQRHKTRPFFTLSLRP